MLTALTKMMQSLHNTWQRLVSHAHPQIKCRLQASFYLKKSELICERLRCTHPGLSKLSEKLWHNWRRKIFVICSDSRNALPSSIWHIHSINNTWQCLPLAFFLTFVHSPAHSHLWPPCFMHMFTVLIRILKWALKWKTFGSEESK